MDQLKDNSSTAAGRARHEQWQQFVRLWIVFLAGLVVRPIPNKFVAAPLVDLPPAVLTEDLALLLAAEVARDDGHIEGVCRVQQQEQAHDCA